MGLKAGLHILQQAGKVATGYADDAARLVAKNGDDVAQILANNKNTTKFLTSDVIEITNKRASLKQKLLNGTPIKNNKAIKIPKCSLRAPRPGFDESLKAYEDIIDEISYYKIQEAIQPDNFNRIALLKGLSSEEIAILQKSADMDANCFFPTLTGHKPACIIGRGEDLSFLSKIKTKNSLGNNFDFVHLKELNNQTFVLNKEKTLEIISRNKDFYTARLGLGNNSSIDDIYNFMLQHKNQVFNCTQTGKFNDLVGITLGFPKQSSMMYQLEILCDVSNLKNIKYVAELRKNPTLYKKIMLETLNKNKELYKNLSVDEYNGLVKAIENYKPIKTEGIADRYYQYVKLADEPTEFARINNSVDDFIKDFSIEKLF